MGYFVDLTVDVIVESVPAGDEEDDGQTSEEDVLPIVHHVRAYGDECRDGHTDDADDPVLKSEQFEVLVHGMVNGISVKIGIEAHSSFLNMW